MSGKDDVHLWKAAVYFRGTGDEFTRWIDSLFTADDRIRGIFDEGIAE